MKLVKPSRLPKRLKLVCTSALLVLSVQIAVAETILIDDFSDGNSDGWTSLDTAFAQPWGPAIAEVNGKNEYLLASRRLVPAGFFGLVGSTWDQGLSDPLYSNGVYRARVRVEGDNTRAGISMRATGTLATGLNAYNFAIQPSRLSGFIRIARLENTVHVDDVALNLSIPMHEDLYLEAAAIGDQLSFKVWPVAEAEPELPQLTWTDSTYEVGTVAVYAFRETRQGGGFVFGGDVSATFDDLTFTTPTNSTRIVPEPASLSLLALVAFALLATRRRHVRLAHAFLVPMLICLVTATLAQQTAAQTTFDIGTLQVASIPTPSQTGVPAPAEIRTLEVPQGKFNAYTFTVDWSQVQGDPWSEEAIWAIADGPLGAAETTTYIDPGSAPNSLRGGQSVSLEWTGMLDLPITGPIDLSLWLTQIYQEGPTTFVANWANTQLELSYVTPPAAPTIDAQLGVVAAPFSAFTIHTAGSAFDTELALYSETGQVVVENDDFDGEVASQIDLSNGLPPGDYVAAISGFNTIFDDGYSVSPGSIGGNYSVGVAGSDFAGEIGAGQVAYIGFRIAEISGDFDGDRDVDGNDFLTWQRGESLDPLSSEDLAAWQANYGAPGSLASRQLVPEPSGALLVTMYLIAATCRMRPATRPFRKCAKTPMPNSQ